MKQHYLRLLVLLLTVPLFTAAHAARYTYDKLHRLTAVTYDSGDSVYYKYDPAGNLLSAASSYKIGGTLTDADGNPLDGAVLTLNGQSITTGTGYQLKLRQPLYSTGYAISSVVLFVALVTAMLAQAAIRIHREIFPRTNVLRACFHPHAGRQN